MEYVYKVRQTHLNFIKKGFEQIQDDSDILSVIPTLTFLVFTFLLTHIKIHRRSRPLTFFKVYLYREILFQWTFFYLTKAWFIILEVNKFFSKWFNNHLQNYHNENKLMLLNSQHIYSISYMLLMFSSMVPFYLFLVAILFKQPVPNFMMWIVDDPWGRSEIGLSGHYLQRPPNFPIIRRPLVAYRPKRSISLDNYLNRNIKPLRSSRSHTLMMYNTPVRATLR